MAEPSTILTVLKVGYNVGNLGYKIVDKALRMIKKNHPAYKEVDKLYDIISKMKDAINLAKDKYFELSIEKRAIEERLEEFKKIESHEQWFEKEMASPGAQVVTLPIEPNLHKNQPPTWYYAGCFAKRELGVMQFCDVKAPYFVYQCTRCQSKILITKEIHESRIQL